MIYEKKYWSEGEFTRKNGEKYVGYVGIFDGCAYIFDTEELLIPTDAWQVHVNTSEMFYDRILDNWMTLPYSKDDIRFGANDFLTSTTLRNIIIKLQTNNDFIFKNTILSNTSLPATEHCSVFGTYNEAIYKFIGKSAKLYDSVTNENKQDIIDGFVVSDVDGEATTAVYPLAVGEKPKTSYSGYYKVPHVKTEYKLKNGYLHQYELAEQRNTKTALDPTFYPQVDARGNASKPPYNFHELTHADITITRVEGGPQPDTRILHLMIFLVFKDKVVAFKYKYYQGLPNQSPDINFNDGSKDIVVLRTIDPANKNSAKFLHLIDMELHGNYMYLVDQKLNMILRYDIAYLLHDESSLGFTLNSIRLIDNVSGDGNVNDRTYFKEPNSIAVDDDWIYVADAGNNCIKKYTASFDYETTLRNGKYSAHHIGAIAVNPYSPTLANGEKLAPGSLWVFSTLDNAMFVSIISDNKTVFTQQIEKIQLLEDKYTWDEELKSVKFSFTNSNYYYLSTTKRVYKFHLSRPTYPFASLSYFKQRNYLSTMIWNFVPYPWHMLPCEEDYNIVWSYRPQNTSAEVLDNRAFCLCGVDKFLKTPENQNVYEQFDGDLIFHIGNFYDQQKVDTYINKHKCTFDKIPTEELKDMIKCSGMFLYIEPASYIYSISNPNVPCYTLEDLQHIDNDEYVNPITFNGHIYKVLYNLMNLKNIIIGRFQGAYNLDNIMVFDQLIIDNYFQQLKIENNHDFFIFNNESTSIVVNRTFENVWDIQSKILAHLQAKYISAQSLTNNTFKII